MKTTKILAVTIGILASIGVGFIFGFLTLNYSIDAAVTDAQAVIFASILTGIFTIPTAAAAWLFASLSRKEAEAERARIEKRSAAALLIGIIQYITQSYYLIHATLPEFREYYDDDARKKSKISVRRSYLREVHLPSYPDFVSTITKLTPDQIANALGIYTRVQSINDACRGEMPLHLVPTDLETRAKQLQIVFRRCWLLLPSIYTSADIQIDQEYLNILRGYCEFPPV